MAKKTQPKTTRVDKSKSKEEIRLVEVMQHYQDWTDDNEKRQTRKNGWNDITDAYYGKLPDDWPFISKTVDPRIRTTILEKNARLLNKPLRGKLAPREGGDVVGAVINNRLLDYQWQTANYGGSMDEKLSISDIDSRLYQSKFAYIYWRTEKDADGNIIFDGNEMMPLDIRDCGLDYNAQNVYNANWFQHRMWVTVEELEEMKLRNISELKSRLNDPHLIAQDRRSNEWQSRLKQIQGLEDRMGEDQAFPVIELVVEYRKDSWTYFTPKYNVILDIKKNPYDHGQIPIDQLTYYKIQDDNLGESEVESVLPIWKAIQATLCGFMDETILKINPPLKVVEGAARIETINRAPDAQWLVDNPNAITEMESSGDAIRYFTNAYPALVSAFNVAMGDLSQGISNIDPLSADKTATEIKQVARQQNARDQKNQLAIGQFIKNIMSKWLSNNRQFLFRDPEKHIHVMKILGDEMFEEFKKHGLDEMIVTQEAASQIEDIVRQITESGGRISDGELNSMIDIVKIPRYPVIENPNEEDVEKMNIKPKMSVEGEDRELLLTQQDLDGSYDYIPDVKAMEAGAGEAMTFARNQMINMMQAPTMLNALAMEGVRPKLKELLIASLEEDGLVNAERFFTEIQPGTNDQTGLPGRPGGVSPLPQAPSAEGSLQQDAQPQQLG